MLLKEKKRDLRKKIRLLKNSVAEQERCALSSIVQQKVLQLEEISNAGTILLYHALPDEVDTSILLHSLSNRLSGSKRVLLPVVDGENLVLKEFVPNLMQDGYMNILEPEGEPVSPGEVDLAIIPGIAFDPRCNRMGRGKGFYDRLLPNMACKKIGIGFHFQIIDEIPCEPFDSPLDMVITDKQVYHSPLRFV
ncbi:MAG: 5-formyltetrahydrofolate cyclo-ligase [Bacteroidales bacterium]|nr:5-formyltetrahydrofolate cyclo-ligase [Bacteroidales bacterium]